MSTTTLMSTVGACLLLGACSRVPASTEQTAADPSRVAPVATAHAAVRRSACDLITADEASAIVGSPLVSQERSGGSPTSSTCSYRPGDGATQEFLLAVTWAGGREAWKAQEQASALGSRLMGGDQSGASTVMKSQPSALGDASSYNPIVGAYVLKGDVLLEFNNLLTLREPRNAWEQLARKALERL